MNESVATRGSQVFSCGRSKHSLLDLQAGEVLPMMLDMIDIELG